MFKFFKNKRDEKEKLVHAKNVQKELTELLKKKNIIAWTTKDLCLWLEYIGFAQYSQAFINNHISGDIFLSLDMADLKAIGIETFGHRKKIMQEGEALISEFSTSSEKEHSSESKSSVKNTSVSQSSDISSDDLSSDKDEENRDKEVIALCILVGDEKFNIKVKSTDMFSKVQKRVGMLMDCKVEDLYLYTVDKLKLTNDTEWKEYVFVSKQNKIIVEKKNPNKLNKLEKKVLNHLNDCCFVIDTKGIIIFINRTAKKVTGYSSRDIMGQNINILMEEETAKKHDKYIQRYLDTKEKRILDKGREAKLKLKNGNICDAWLSVTENKNKSGRHTFTGTLHLLEKEVRNHAAHTNFLILDALKEAILVINSNSVITFANRAAENLLGYTVDEYLGQNINMMMPEPYHSLHEGYIKNYLKSGKKKVIGTPGRIVASKSKSGELVPVLLEVKEFEFEGDRHFIGVMSKKQLVVEETSHLETCRQIISNLLMPILLVDDNLLIQGVNNAFTEALGFELIELLEQSLDNIFNGDFVTNKLKQYIKEKANNELIGNKSSSKVVCRNNVGKLKIYYLTATYKKSDDGDGLFLLLLNQEKIK